MKIKGTKGQREWIERKRYSIATWKAGSIFLLPCSKQKPLIRRLFAIAHSSLKGIFQVPIKACALFPGFSGGKDECQSRGGKHFSLCCSPLPCLVVCLGYHQITQTIIWLIICLVLSPGMQEPTFLTELHAKANILSFLPKKYVMWYLIVSRNCHVGGGKGYPQKLLTTRGNWGYYHKFLK